MYFSVVISPNLICFPYSFRVFIIFIV
jgi:hypothetical protein